MLANSARGQGGMGLNYVVAMRLACALRSPYVDAPCHGQSFTREVPLSSDAPMDERRGSLEVRSSGESLAGSEMIGLFGRFHDLEALERAALALTVHPLGGGFERAWLFVWDGCSGLLEGRGVGRGPAPAPPLGEWIERAVTQGLMLEPAAGALRLRPRHLGGVVAQVWSPGASGASPEPEAGLPWTGAAHVGAVALRRSGLPWALVVGTWSEAPGRERRAALDATAALCGQAARALDHASEGKRRGQQAAALAQVARAAGSTLNLAEVLQEVVRLAALATGARGSALWLSAPPGLRLEATHGSAGRRERTAQSLQALAQAVVEQGTARVVERATEELLLGPEAAADLDSVLVCPLRAYGRVLGALACYARVSSHRSDPRGFPAGEVEFTAALADLAALAVDQAAHFAKLRQGEQERCELTARLQREERLAWLGDLAVRMVQDARNPLASIGAFTRRVQRTLPEDDPNREYLEIVLRESQRLERLLEEQLAYPPAEGSLRSESLNAVVQEALAAVADALVRRRVRLVKKLSPDLPPLLLDRERIRRVVTNMLQSALETVGAGGRVRLETRGLGSYVLLELAHDAPRAPGDLLEQVFVPFASQRPGGAAVGLAVARQIVREHGGEIRVRSDGEWGTVFSLSLPVQENRDRRRGGADRRRSRGDRRAAPP